MDRDAVVEIAVSEDSMEATGTFVPAQGDGRLLEPAYLDSMLESQGVVFGVHSEDLAEVMFEVNTTHRILENVPVASGKPPVAACPAFFRVIQHTASDADSFRHDVDRIDYKRVSRLPVVRKGETVGRRIPARPGQPGTNVLGEEVPFTTEVVDPILPGKNTILRDDRVLAEVGGQLQMRDGRFLVEDRLEITGNVDYGTGSVEFPGDVVIKGEVREGFHVWAGGSITCTGTVDVSEIFCRKDFSALGGLVGRGRALLRCGGRVQSKFVGNCNLESKASVFVKQYVYHSHIGCLDRFAMGNRGRIIGGVITAAQGARCYTAGNEARVTTIIRVGTDFITERKLKLTRDRLQAVTLKLQKLQAALPDDPSDRQVTVLHKLEGSRSSLAIEMGDLAGELDRFEQAEVTVDGVVYPGVQIHICRATLVVESLMKKTRFFLDKRTGHVVAEPLESGSGKSDG